jgi:UPF0755 protein
MGRKATSGTMKKLLKGILIIAGLVVLIAGYFSWRIAFKANIFTKSQQKTAFFYVPTGSNANTIEKLLLQQFTIDDPTFFKIVFQAKCKISRILPGKYKIVNGMSNKDLIKELRPANRLQVKLTIKFFRKKEELAKFVSDNLEVKNDELMTYFNSNDSVMQLGFNTFNILSMFTPNTYFFNWNTSTDEFIDRMYKEYLKFWTESRILKAQSQGLTPLQAITMASIVDRETNYNPEKPIIAGVYLNRLRDSMPLQADPTIVYAVNDFTIKRVRKGHLMVNSPYNTYINIGLPPGPICTPSVSSIDAVLNAQHHKYMFFCAKEDFSCQHNFAETFQQHLANARKFQKAMNEHAIE